jgi:PST family polysaccharide transporter
LALQGDNLVVGHSLGPGALGIYGRAYNLMSAPAVAIGKVLDDVLFPTLARVQDDVERLARGFRRAVAVISIATLPASATMVILAPELVRVALGPQWSEVVGPFRILAAGLLFRTSYKISDSLARSTGAVYRRAKRQVVYAGLVVGGAYIGQGWGLEGVATGVLLALLVNFVLMAQLSLQLCRLSWRSFLEFHLPAIALTCGVGLASWACATWLRHLGLPAGVILLATVTSAFASLVWLGIRFPNWTLGPEGRWTVDTLRSVFRKARLPGETGGVKAIQVVHTRP